MNESAPVQKQDIDHLSNQLSAIIELLEKLVMLLGKEDCK